MSSCTRAFFNLEEGEFECAHLTYEGLLCLVGILNLTGSEIGGVDTEDGGREIPEAVYEDVCIFAQAGD